MNSLLRMTLVTLRPDEVAFVYIPKERIDKSIFARRFGSDQEADENGVTYSLTRNDLDKCFNPQKQSIKTFNWIASVSPTAARMITSVALPDSSNTTSDQLITFHAPAFAASTVGTTVVNFIQEHEADAFVQRLQMSD